MKRPDPALSAWLLRQVRGRATRQQQLARRRKHLQRILGITEQPQRRPTAVLCLPSALTAERGSSRSAITSTLRTMVTSLADPEARVKLDFSSVRHILPGGMLMLLAHVELLAEAFPGRIRASCPQGSIAAQLIRHFDFGHRLRVPSNGNTPTHSSVTGWRFATGKLAEGEKIHRHIADFASQVKSSLPDGLYNALVEAMNNVRHHAYPDDAENGIPEKFQRWWMFSKCRAPQHDQPGELYLAFYDIGIGIQNSLRRNLVGAGEHALAAFVKLAATLGVGRGKLQDTQLLRIAVEQNRTTTGLPFRGKGLPEMKEFAASTTGGRLTIVSGFAQYNFRANSGPATVVRCEQAIVGTLILWNLPLTWKDVTPCAAS